VHKSGQGSLFLLSSPETIEKVLQNFQNAYFDIVLHEDRLEFSSLQSSQKLTLFRPSLTKYEYETFVANFGKQKKVTYPPHYFLEYAHFCKKYGHEIIVYTNQKIKEDGTIRCYCPMKSEKFVFILKFKLKLHSATQRTGQTQSQFRSSVDVHPLSHPVRQGSHGSQNMINELTLSNSNGFAKAEQASRKKKREERSPSPNDQNMQIEMKKVKMNDDSHSNNSGSVVLERSHSNSNSNSNNFQFLTKGKSSLTMMKNELNNEPNNKTLTSTFSSIQNNNNGMHVNTNTNTINSIFSNKQESLSFINDKNKPNQNINQQNKDSLSTSVNSSRINEILRNKMDNAVNHIGYW